MPWQQQVADVGLELLDDGRPAYREVLVTVPRQSGKTMLLLAWELHRALIWAKDYGAQKIIYSAQTGNDARKKLVEDQLPILTSRKKLLEIVKVTQGMGSESVQFANGSRIGLLAGTEDSGHGKTVDLGVKDELFADGDMRRDQALIPAMSTRSHGQLLAASTMGTIHSVALNVKVDQGRSAVEQGKQTGIAYFEWSAALDADPADPATWWTCMPALGRTVGLEAVEHAYQTMPLGEFRRAFTNVMTSADERVIPQGAWDLINRPDVEATADVFGVDVNPERSAAAIVACGGTVLEVVNYKAGVAWLPGRCAELHAQYGAPMVLDASGPAASFAQELERLGVPVILLAPRDMVRACGSFYDAVIGEAVTIRRHPELDAAVSAASKRSVGDAWSWARKSSRMDISPLVAATVALWAAGEGKAAAEPAAYYSLSEVIG